MIGNTIVIHVGVAGVGGAIAICIQGGSGPNTETGRKVTNIDVPHYLRKRFARGYGLNRKGLTILNMARLVGISAPFNTERPTRMQSHLLDCLQGLTESSQRSITLAYLEGYSREEIANLMQTKVNTVKSWLRRGAERLRQCLEAKIEPNQ